MSHALTTLLDDFVKLPARIERPSTFMEIAGYPHYENVYSNILAFYLDPEEAHGLGTLVLDALARVGSIAAADEGVGGNVSVEREVITDNGNRIDILIETDAHAILIENKIYASVENTLSTSIISTWTRCSAARPASSATTTGGKKAGNRLRQPRSRWHLDQQAGTSRGSWRAAWRDWRGRFRTGEKILRASGRGETRKWCWRCSRPNARSGGGGLNDRPRSKEQQQIASLKWPERTCPDILDALCILR
jgi:PD-(D/E)XK nuclease superfamily